MRDEMIVPVSEQPPPAPLTLADIVIVNWNSGAWLKRCVASIAAHGEHRIATVTVVDNGSADGSAALDFADLPIEVVETGANLGFGRACNLGALRGTAPYILFLNPDAALMAGTLATAVDFLEAPVHADVGVCGVKLVGEDGMVQRHCGRLPTPATFLAEASGVAALFPARVPTLLDRGFDHLSSRDVDHVIGAFYLIRRDLFNRLGGFDERFFVYLEDLDLSARVHAAGYRIHYLAGASGFHYGGGTSDQVKPQRLAYALESRIAYAFKHFSVPAALAVAAMTLGGEPLPRIMRAAARRSGQETRDILKGFGLLWRRVACRATRRRSGNN